MAIYIATNHDPVPDPPCPVCKGGGVDWKVRKDGQFDRRFKYSAHPCPACNGSGHRDGDWRAHRTEVSPEFAAQLRAHLSKRRPDAATLRRWIELGRIPED
jgi:hypothetical protein